MTRWILPLGLLLLVSNAAQAEEELDKLMVKVICSPTEFCETLLPDLQRDLEEDAEVLITNRFRGRLTVGDENTFLKANKISRSQYNQLCDEGACMSEIAEQLGFRFAVEMKVSKVGLTAVVVARLFSQEQGVYLLVEKETFLTGEDLKWGIEELVDPLMDHLGGLLEQNQAASCTGDEQIVDIRGPKGIQVEIAGRKLTLSRGRYMHCLEPGTYPLTAAGSKFFPFSTTVRVAQIPVSVVVNPIRLGTIRVVGEPAMAEVRWQQPVSPGSGQIRDHDVFSMPQDQKAHLLEGAVPGKHLLIVTHPGYETLSHEIQMVEGAHQNVRLILTERGRLTIVGKPQGARVKLTAVKGRTPSCRGLGLHPQAKRSIRCEDMDGRYALTVYKEGFAQFGPVQIDLAAGQQKRQTIALEYCPRHLPPEACSAVLKGRQRNQRMSYIGSGALLLGGLGAFVSARQTAQEFNALFRSREDIARQEALASQFTTQLMLGATLTALSGGAALLGHRLGQRTPGLEDSKGPSKEAIRRRAQDKLRRLRPD